MDPSSRITRIESQIRNQQSKKLLYTNSQQNSIIFQFLVSILDPPY